MQTNKKLLTSYAKGYIFKIQITQTHKKRGEKMPCRNLRAEMARKKVSIEDIAECLQIHRNSASNKVNGNTAFSIEESVKIQETFFPDLELKYLFKREKEE